MNNPEVNLQKLREKYSKNEQTILFDELEPETKIAALIERRKTVREMLNIMKEASCERAKSLKTPRCRDREFIEEMKLIGICVHLV